MMLSHVAYISRVTAKREFQLVPGVELAEDEVSRPISYLNY